MDATRSDREFVYWMLEQCIEAGATTVNIPDTVGYTIPEEFAQFITRHPQQRAEHRQGADLRPLPQRPRPGGRELARRGPRGARQIETCINGIGERAGNAALEEVAMAIKTRRDFFDVETNINTKELYRTSRLVSEPDGHERAAEQGDRRPERVPPPVRHPPGRHPEDARDVRDHGRERHRLADGRRRDRARQGLRPSRLQGAHGRAGLRADAKRSCRAPSWRSRSWPTRRPRSTTATSRRSSPTSCARRPSSTASTSCR